MTRTGIQTKQMILTSGLSLARGGLSRVTLRGVARLVGVDHRTVCFHFGPLQSLQDAIAAEALRCQDAIVVARLIIDKHPAVADLPGADRARYMTALA